MKLYMCTVGNQHAHCSLCGTDFGISHGGRNDVTSHLKTKKHSQMAKASTSTSAITTLFQRPPQRDLSIEAEVRWATFIVKHNISFMSNDHASNLFQKMFSDSQIAKKFTCARTKTTAIVKTALSPYYSERVFESMRSSPFSLMMDESNDKSDKSCIILSTFLDPKIGEVRTRFVGMPVVNIGTAANLFEALNESLAKYGLGFSNAVAFMSDTTNVMKGKRSGVQKLIRDENPFLLDVGCICHLADLTVKAGMKTMPVDIDQLFIDIFYYFHHSSKRKQHFADQWCSMFTTEPESILKHCPTRWVSILRCVKRYLKQFDGLRSFFLSCEEAETAKVQSIVARLDNPLTKPLLHFLSFILPSMDQFNRLFQKSTQNTTCQLYDEMNRVVRLYASNFLKADTILEAGANLKSLKLDASNQLTDENLGIGTDTWTNVAEPGLRPPRHNKDTKTLHTHHYTYYCMEFEV